MCLIDMWIVRNKKDETLRLFKTKPQRIDEEGRWVKDGYYGCWIDSTILDDERFEDLTWDDEPIEVEFIRKDEKPLAYCYNCKTTFSYDKKSLDDVFTNTIESFWSHFKKMVFSTYQSVSKKYLQRYIDEEVYRWNARKMSESARFVDMLKKSLTRYDYKAVIA